MLKNNWERIELKNLCHKIGDGLHGTPEYSDTDIYFINGNNLKNGKIVITKDTKTVSDIEYNKHYIPLNNKTLLLSINGTLGSLAFYNNEKVMLGKSTAYLNFKTDINSFYYYYFQLKEIQDYFHNVATGSTIKNLSLKSIQEFEVPVPKLYEWKSIVRVLSSIDKKIELNNQINQKLEAMAKTLYDYWFVQFDFPDANSKPYKSSGGKMVYSEELKREIPEGWEVKKIKDIATVIMGQSPKSEFYNNVKKGIPLINGAADYEYGSLMARTYTTSSTRLCKKDDLVFCIRATIGNLTFAEKEYCLGRGVAAVRANEKILGEILFYALLQEIERFKIHATGSIIKGITRDDLTDSYIVIPPDTVIEKFHAICFPIFSLQRKNKKEIQKLTQLRDWLLPMLMNGQVKVGDNEKKD